jgi:hypothetical protein
MQVLTQDVQEIYLPITKQGLRSVLRSKYSVILAVKQVPLMWSDMQDHFVEE